MKTNIYFTERETEKELSTDPIGIYNAIEDGLPAYLGSTRVSINQLKFKLGDPDFEKLMRRLRFLKRHVELWKEGGPKAISEAIYRSFWPDWPDAPTKEPQKKDLLPCKAGTTWRQITITKKANDMVRIKTPQGQSLFTYHELGLQDGRSPDRPTKLWDLLIAFAERTGVIHSENYHFDKHLPSRAKRLNKRLREIFGIKDSIYTENYKKEKAYRTKIAFEDETF